MITNILRFCLRWVVTIFRMAVDLLRIGETPRNFQEHKVYQVVPSNNDQHELLGNISENSHFDFWTPRHSDAHPVAIMVSPTRQSEFEAQLEEYGFEYNVLIHDVESVLTRERSFQNSGPELEKGKITFEKYLRYSEIQDYLNQLAVDYSRLVLLENYGMSSEKRNLTLIRISTGGKRSKPAIFIDAGIHAREWIAPAQALYIIHQLLENPENRNLIENVDWVVIPLLNPDGYEYSHTDDRFWRKTRSIGKTSYGVDANRNFDFHWREFGASDSESSPIYPGPSAFSEPETLALRNAIEAYSNRIKLYLSLHSAAQCILYPWGYTFKAHENVDELRELAQQVEKTIRAVNGTKYRIGSSYGILQPMAGSSRDWVAGVAGVKLSYTFELPGGGMMGFDLPADRILSVVQEVFQGVKEFHRYVLKECG